MDLVSVSLYHCICIFVGVSVRYVHVIF